MMLSVEKSYTSLKIIHAKVLGVFYLMLHVQYRSCFPIPRFREGREEWMITYKCLSGPASARPVHQTCTRLTVTDRAAGITQNVQFSTSLLYRPSNTEQLSLKTEVNSTNQNQKRSIQAGYI